MWKLAAIISLLLTGMVQAMTPEEVARADQLFQQEEYTKLLEMTLPDAEEGNAQAMTYAGLSYDGLEQPERACDWYEKAAQQQHPRGTGALAICFHAGQGRPQNFRKAETLYLQAIRLGWDKSAMHLGRLYWKGNLGKVDIKQAENWLKYASDRGSASASFSLGYLYLNEFNDREKLIHYARKTGEQGQKRGWVVLYINGSAADKNEAWSNLTLSDWVCSLWQTYKDDGHPWKC